MMVVPCDAAPGIRTLLLIALLCCVLHLVASPPCRAAVPLGRELGGQRQK